jgi:hypothetical protein
VNEVIGGSVGLLEGQHRFIRVRHTPHQSTSAAPRATSLLAVPHGRAKPVPDRDLVWHAGHMPSDQASSVPFDVRDGWPDRLDGTTVSASEAGVLLGSLLLADSDWASLRASIVFSLRIDDHPLREGLTTRYPDGSVEHSEFVIPIAPVVAPRTALTSSRAFSDWVWHKHGLVGRLLVWDDPKSGGLSTNPTSRCRSCARLPTGSSEPLTSSRHSLGYPD